MPNGLSSVSILIKTFLRDNYLVEAVGGIEAMMPEVRMIIVDDGETKGKDAFYYRLRDRGHVVIQLPFDSGFGAKSNAAIEAAYDRPYLLIGSDDFDFFAGYVRPGIEKLVTVLDSGLVDIASGRVNGNRYEGWLEDGGTRIVERYIDLNPAFAISANGIAYYRCDLTVNYSLIRSSILGFDENQVHWDDDVKIGGGEHGAFFIDVKRAGYSVGYVPGVDIREQSGKPTDVRYQMYRGRAGKSGRPCFAKRNIQEYVCFDGSIERP